MVHDEDLARMPIDKPDHLRQMSLKDQQAVAKSDALQVRHPTIEVVAKHVEVVGLVMQHMANALILGVAETF
jgi:hypothetical protein